MHKEKYTLKTNAVYSDKRIYPQLESVMQTVGHASNYAALLRRFYLCYADYSKYNKKQKYFFSDS